MASNRRSGGPRLALLAVMVVLALLVGAGEAGQNLRKTTCPICNMDVKATINATVLGGQHVYACEMAGHIDALQNDPVRWRGVI